MKYSGRCKCRRCKRWMMFAPMTPATPLERGPVPHADACMECLPFKVAGLSEMQQKTNLAYLKSRYKPSRVLWAMVTITYQVNGYEAALTCFHNGIKKGIGRQ